MRSLCLGVLAFGASGVCAGEAPSGSLLIVAPRALVESVRGYARERSADVPARVVILEEALASSIGVDDPERLKRYLHAEWKKGEGSPGRLRYVLLVGDADVMPVRYMCLDRCTDAAFDYAFYPADLYYADVAKADGTFDNWNAAASDFHGGYFGEVRGEKNKSDPINYDGVDYKPELAVGRWPASTARDVETIAAKSLAYCKGLSDGSRTGPAKAGLVAVGGWIENRGMMDAAGASLPKAWVVEKRYWGEAAASGDGDAAGKAPARGPDEQNVVDLMNEGVSVLLHSGHGSDDLWEQSISVHSIEKLRNADRLPVVMSAGCSTARFATLPPYEAYVDVLGTEHVGTDKGETFTAPPPPPACYQTGRFNPTGLGERLLRDGPNGAVAYIGCNTGSQPCGMTLLGAFAEEIGERADSGAGARLGDCWASAVAKYYERENLATIAPDAGWYPASMFFQGMKFMVFGDPSLAISSPPKHP